MNATEHPFIIAFYLPQFYPTETNDKWWGEGFTEWTNVRNARPLYWGHYQPKVPTELGYYDLRQQDVREAQAAFAREAGIGAFCYWSYWFGGGREELDEPFDAVVESGKPDFPFMLCWANESWHTGFWNRGERKQKSVIVQQTYPGDDDIYAHFYRRLKAFKDNRYLKIENRPVFMIYEWRSVPQVERFIRIWNELAIKAGFDGIYFIAHLKHPHDLRNIDEPLAKGFDAVNTIRLWEADFSTTTKVSRGFRKLNNMLFGVPRVRSYKSISRHFVADDDRREGVFPTLVPNWDHSPRSGRNALIFHNSTPTLFERHCREVLTNVRHKSGPNMVFLRAWNEWGEGNYMEPDLKYGKGYIEALKKAVDNIAN